MSGEAKYQYILYKALTYLQYLGRFKAENTGSCLSQQQTLRRIYFVVPLQLVFTKKLVKWVPTGSNNWERPRNQIHNNNYVIIISPTFPSKFQVNKGL